MRLPCQGWLGRWEKKRRKEKAGRLKGQSCKLKACWLQFIYSLIHIKFEPKMAAQAQRQSRAQTELTRARVDTCTNTRLHVFNWHMVLLCLTDAHYTSYLVHNSFLQQASTLRRPGWLALAEENVSHLLSSRWARDCNDIITAVISLLVMNVLYIWEQR